MAAFLLTAALNLLHLRAGFLTNHLADLTVPALLSLNIAWGALPESIRLSRCETSKAGALMSGPPLLSERMVPHHSDSTHE